PSFHPCTSPAPTSIYTLSLHDALPIFVEAAFLVRRADGDRFLGRVLGPTVAQGHQELEQPHSQVRRHPRDHAKIDQRQLLVGRRSEEHTSELQSPYDLVCRLLLEKKKK